MTLKSVTLALIAGVTAFVIIGVAATELAARWVEFSLFVGIPAGVVAGTIAAGGVYLGLADAAPPQRRRVAKSVAGFGVVFLTVLVSGAAVFDLGTVATLSLGVVLGVVAAVLSYRGTGATPRAAK